jgi:hypothetical protein
MNTDRATRLANPILETPEQEEAVYQRIESMATYIAVAHESGYLSDAELLEVAGHLKLYTDRADSRRKTEGPVAQ